MTISRPVLRACDRFFGTILATLLSIFPNTPSSQAKPPRSIVFIKLFAIGEAILTLPALELLSKEYPGSSVTIITTEYVADIYSGHPFVRKVLILPSNPILLALFIYKNTRSFDVCIDGEPYLFASAILAKILGKNTIGFATCGRDPLFSNAIQYNDTQHAVLTYCDLVMSGDTLQKYPDTLIPIQYSQHDVRIVEKFLTDHSLGKQVPIIILCPSVGASAKGRMWPIDRFSAVANAILQTKKVAFICLGTKNDTNTLQIVQQSVQGMCVIASNFTISQASYLIRRATLVIANDSGLMHVASAMNTPTIGLFGQNTPTRFAPYSPHSTAIYHPCPTSPHINVHKGEIPNISCACMQNISILEVAQVADNIISLYAKKL